MCYRIIKILQLTNLPPKQDEAAPPASLKAEVRATFPDSDIGLRLVNGKPTRAFLEVSNHEDAPIQVAFVSGSLSSTAPQAADKPAYENILRNLTASQYGLSVDAGESKQVPYAFSLDMQPQDVLLELVAVLADSQGGIYQMSAYSSTASIVEPPTSFLDPQMYVNLAQNCGFMPPPNKTREAKNANRPAPCAESSSTSF